MLKATDLAKISKLIKIPVADLEKAIKDTAEVDVAVPEDLTVLTAAELETRDNNSKNDGIKAGKEIGVKEVREKAGLEAGIGKDPEKVAKAIAEKAITDAKIEPDKKVKLLDDQIKQLQTALGEKDSEIATERKKAGESAQDRKILASMPKNRADFLSDDQYLTLIKGSLVIEEVEGKQVVKKGGEVLRDPATKNPLTVEAAITGLFTESKGWLAEAGAGGAGGGRGAGDTKILNTFTKRSEVVAHFEAQGKSINGEAGQEISNKLAELKKANAEFDLVN